MNVEKGHLAAEGRSDGESDPGARRRLCSDLRQDNRGHTYVNMERTG